MFVSSRRICDPLARWMGGWMVIPQDTLEIPIRLFRNSYRNWSLWLWCILFHWVEAIMTLTNSWHLLLWQWCFCKIHLIVTSHTSQEEHKNDFYTFVFSDITGTIWSPRFLKVTNHSIARVVVCLCRMFFEPITSNHLCGETDSLQEVLEVCRLHGQWDLCPSLGMEPWMFSMHQNISDFRKQADAIWRSRKISERCWIFMAIACRVREHESLSPAEKTEHLPRAPHLYIQKCMSSPLYFFYHF